MYHYYNYEQEESTKTILSYVDDIEEDFNTLPFSAILQNLSGNDLQLFEEFMDNMKYNIRAIKNI